MRSVLSILILLLAGITCRAQNQFFDSLRNELANADEADRLQILEELCYQFMLSSRQDSLKKYVTELTEQSDKSTQIKYKALSKLYESQSHYRGDTVLFFSLAASAEELAGTADCNECLALVYLGYGLKYRTLQRYSEAIAKQEKGLALVKEPLTKREREIKFHLHIAKSAAYHYQSKYAEALTHSLEAATLAHQLNDIYLSQKIYNSLSAVYGELYSPDNNLGTQADRDHYKSLAKYYMKKNYESSLVASSKKASAVAAYNLGLFFSEEKIADSARYFLDKSIALGIDAGFPELLSNAYNVKGGDYATVYPDSAILFFDKAIAYAKDAGFVSNQATAMISKATILQMKGFKKEAITLAQEGLNLSKQADVRTTTMNAYKLLAELNEQNGNTAESYSYFKKYIALKDSVVSEENFGRIEELKARYDSDLKDSEIKNLSQTASIQALEIKQRNTTLIGLLIFIALAVFAGVLFIRQRTVVQQQKQLELENRFLRFQLNPHFLSNALVSIQHFLFESNANMASDYLGRFSRLMRQFLEYSRKEIIPIENEVEVLRNYLDIQKLGFQNGFNYSIEIDEDLDVALDKIPPMFAQPFIENALEHGIKGMKDGNITIVFKKENNFVRLVITDNGKGLTASTSNKNHQSLATTIIRERIDLLNKVSKEKIKMMMSSGENETGTRVEIVLPIYY